MGKEGKANIKFIVSILFFSLLMAILVYAATKPGFDDAKIWGPQNKSINLSLDRNINFTFNVTWDLDVDTVGNCSLWTNFSGSWASMMEINGSTLEATVHNGSGNISVNRTSWMNYTFTHDIGLMVWSIGCRNATAGANLNWTFNPNWTLAIDTAAPNITFTDNTTSTWNTTSANPAFTFIISDVNGTGVNLTPNGDNVTLNITVSNVNSGADDDLVNYNISNSSLSCTGEGGDYLTSTECTLTLDTYSLTNGTKNITISVSDRAAWVNITSFTFTVDQIPPALQWINLTNSSEAITAVSVLNGTGSLRPGQVLYLSTNLTDNLTYPLNISLEWYNYSDGTWNQVDVQTPNATSSSTGAREDFWGNASFTLPTGRNEFEGRNVSFRAVYSDILGNSNDSSSITLMVQVNDTYAPTITINGTFAENGTNISDTTPLISWVVNENNKLQSINVSVDGTLPVGTGIGDGCVKSAFYDTSVGDDNVELFRNGSFTISSTSTCPLGNGTHSINVTAIDIWGNLVVFEHTFSVQSGSIPGLAFNLTFEDADGTWIKNNINGSNITSRVGVTLFGYNGVGAAINKISYISSCNSTAQVIGNNTVIYPFNTTSEAACGTESENRTLTVTINDTVGNSNTTVLGFMVDNVAPTITVHNPTQGFSTTGIIEVNVSAFDGEGQVEWIRYYLDGGFTSLNHTHNGSELTGTFGQNTTSLNTTINFTAGTHTIKISVNDTLGNIRNSSEITFTYNGPFNFLGVNRSLMTAVSVLNYSNISVFNSSGGLISDTSTPRSVNETYELFMALNSSGANINVSINFNGSAANWDELNFTVGHNYTRYIAGIENNFTADIIELISFNTSSDGFTDSIDEFLTDSNSYYGYIDFTFNATNMTTIGGNDAGALGGIFELWYFEDETALNSKVNITECTQNKEITHKTASSSNFPCWNNTINTSVRVYVPHFSAVALVNDSIPPTVNVQYPKDTQTESSFVPNITASNDAVLCNYSYRGKDYNGSNTTMTLATFGNEKICTASEISVINGTAQNNNITFYVWDVDDNLNTTVFNFNVSDLTFPNMTAEPSSSGSTTGATITYTANESVNVTARYYSTFAGIHLGTNVSTGAIDFAKTQEITISGLSTVTSAKMWYFNVTSCDKAGNCIQNGTYNFTQTETAAAAAAAAAAAGGGGGGAAAVSTVADSKAQVWSAVPAGSSFSLDVDKATIAITSVAVSDVKSELKNVDLEVQALKENPVSTEATANVYQYLRINKKNIADADAGTFKVGFRVTKVWLTENSLASGDISLYRYKGDKWNELATSVTGTDDTYVNYEAETPGFSSFAIGTKSGVVVEEEVPEEVPPEEVPEEVAPPEEVEVPTPVVAPSKAPIAWIIALIVIILGIVLIVAYQKKKKQV